MEEYVNFYGLTHRTCKVLICGQSFCGNRRKVTRAMFINGVSLVQSGKI